MNITATISGDCRYLSISASGTAGPADITIESAQGTHTLTLVLPTGNAVQNQIVFLSSTNLGSKGVYEITGTDSQGNDAYAGAFAKCDLDCCIAKKMDHILSCDCSCTKCNKELLIAERVHLLIVAIESDLAQIGGDPVANTAYFETARKKYEKAVSLCMPDCGCSC